MCFHARRASIVTREAKAAPMSIRPGPRTSDPGTGSRPDDDALRVRELSVAFGDVRAVDSVTMTIDVSGCSGLIGPNGSGKTSFINAVSGFVPARGFVELCGRRIKLGDPGSALRSGIGRTFQTPQTFDNLTCLENVLLGTAREGGCGVVAAWVRRRSMHVAERDRARRARELLDLMGLSPHEDQLAGELAYGQQRRLELARAMASGPRMVLLDEPAAGLNDTETEHLASVIEELRDRGVAFFLVEHKLDFVRRLCTRLAVLSLGKVIAEGAPEDVLADRAVADAYLGRKRRA
jgi:ABC-type branched-subunit amino acid transport system ATPase component